MPARLAANPGKTRRHPSYPFEYNDSATGRSPGRSHDAPETAKAGPRYGLWRRRRCTKPLSYSSLTASRRGPERLVRAQPRWRIDGRPSSATGGKFMAMTMTGEATLPAARPKVWALLNDPDVLKACIPGCQSLERSRRQRFRRRRQDQDWPGRRHLQRQGRTLRHRARGRLHDFGRRRGRRRGLRQGRRQSVARRRWRTARCCATTSKPMSGARWPSSARA